jgi:hypothetical protein
MSAKDALLGAAPVDWPVPDDLRNGLAKLHPWPRGKLLPLALENFGLAFAERLCLDPSPVMLAFLTATTTVLNGRVFIRPDVQNPTWQEPTALWLAVVMGVATKKTPMLKAALAPCWAIEKVLRKQAEEEQEQHRTALARWEATDRKERGPKPLPPVPSRLLAQDATREALADLLVHNPGLLAYHDELAGLFKVWGREDRGSERAFYLAAHSGAPVSVDRIMRGSTFIERPVLSLLGFIQPGPFRERVLEGQTEGAGADGLLQRFVVVTAQEQPWVEDRPTIDPGYMDDYHRLVERIWDGLLHSGERVLTFSDDAQQLWRRWESEVEQEIRFPDISDAWRALLGKRLGLTARFAAVLHMLWEQPESVSEVTLRRAIALVQWLEPHNQVIWKRALHGNQEPVLKLARKLQTEELAELTVRTVSHKQMAGIATAEEARRVLGVLAEAGWVIPNGKVFVVNPRVKEVFGV